MIDAYEIGIQLLLQEDVSAGLAVINRDLADVDRAIAATSVKLAGLGQAAERVGKAVSAATGAKATIMPAADTKTALPNSDAPTSLANRSAPLDTASSLDRVAELKAEPSSSPSKSPMTEDRQALRPPSIPSVIERPTEASSPNKAVAGEMATPVQRAPAPLEKLNDNARPTLASNVASAPETSQRSNGRDVAPGEIESKQGTAVPSAPLAVTAAIRHSGTIDRPPSMGSNQMKAQLENRFQSGSERVAAAPWSAMDRIPQQTLTVRPAERAAAPQSPGRDRAEGGGGAVMLDGRLVGQWLSEHMGREASRPPGGTNFFDARQTPAWNVSGAL